MEQEGGIPGTVVVRMSDGVDQHKKAVWIKEEIGDDGSVGSSSEMADEDFVDSEARSSNKQRRRPKPGEQVAAAKTSEGQQQEKQQSSEGEDGAFAEGAMLFEKRFISFCAILVVIVALFSTLIFVCKTYINEAIPGTPEIEQCLNDARAVLANVCTSYKVVCKNSALVIDVGD